MRRLFIPSSRHCILFLGLCAAGFLFVCYAAKGDVPPASESAAEGGLIIESVGPASISARSGLKAGDHLLGWSLAQNPEGFDSAQPFTSVHQVRWLEIETAPRGDVILFYRRDTDRRDVRLSVGDWKISARPNFSSAVLDLYLAARDREDAGDPAQAFETYRSAAERVGDFDAPAAVFLLERAAQAACSAKDWESAKAAMTSAIELVSGEEQPAWAAMLQMTESEIHGRLGHVPEAESALSGAIRRLDGQGRLQLIRALVFQKRGELRFRAGRLDEAEADMRAALNLRRDHATAGLWVSRSLGSLATLDLSKGRIRDAREQIEAALAVEDAHDPGSITVGAYLSNLALIARYEGRLKEAEGYLDRYAQILETRGDGQLDRRASIANNRALLRAAMGDLEGAEDLLDQAIELKTKYGSDDNLKFVMSLTNLANVRQLRGRLEEAESAAERAVTTLERIAPDGIPLAAALGTLGNIARERSELERAESLYQRALSILSQQNPGSLRVARVLSNQAGVALAAGNLVRAEQLTREALATIEELAPESEDAITNRRLLGKILQQMGRLDEAWESYRDCLDSLDHLARHSGQSDLRQIVFWSKASEYYGEAVEIAVERGRPTEAYDVFERSRARAMLRLLAERKIPTAPPEIHAQLARVSRKYEAERAKLAAMSTSSDAAELEALRASLRSIRREQERLWEETTRDRSHWLRSATPRSAASVQNVLSPGALFVAFSVGVDQTVVFAMTDGDGLFAEMLDVGEAELRKAVEGFRADLRDGRAASGAGGIRLSRAQRRGEDLFELLLAPVRSRIESADRLVVVPDSVLHDLPFSALVTTRHPEVEYLVEALPVSMVLSGSVLASLRQVAPLAETSENPKLVAFGDPRYGRAPGGGESAERAKLRAAGQWAELPGSRREVERIVSLFSEAEAFLGPEATEEKFADLGDPTYLHLACHGFADSRSPLDSVIALSVPQETDPEATENGLLYAWEVLEKVRFDASLVVISACSSASGANQGGEGLVGISWAFQGAGAQSVLAPLWTIRDDMTPDFMESFYRALLSGKQKDEALRLAQLEFIRGPNSSRRAPYYWAPFQLYGDFE